MEAWFFHGLGYRGVLSGAVDALFMSSLQMSSSPFDTVDRRVLDRVLSSLGLPAWFRHASLVYHAHVACGLRLLLLDSNGGIPQGCPLSVMFIVALYLLCCKHLEAQEG